jgi:hypothetical protein
MAVTPTPFRAAMVRRRTLVLDRRTVALGAVAGATTLAVLAAELGRVWRRGSAPLPGEADDLLQAAEEAVGETVEVAKAGYREAPSRENSLFNLFVAFAATVFTARGIATLLRDRSRVGPFRNLRLGRRHIHHFVPGIVIAFLAGGTAIISRDERIEPKLALAFGVGLGLTVDESALLLELEDVYWTPEGLVSVQIALTVSALMAAALLGLRLLRRGEQVVLERPEPPPAA